MNDKYKTISLFSIAFVSLMAIGAGLWSGLDLWESIYDAFKIFGGNYDYSEGNAVLKAACVLAPVSLFCAFITFFYQKIKTFSFLHFHFVKDKYVLIFGAGDMGKTLALDIKNNYKKLNLKVVVIEQDEDNPNIDSLRDNKIMVIEGDGTSESLLNKLPLKKASDIIFLTGSDLVNLNIYSTLKTIKAKKYPENSSTKYFIHLQQEENIELLNKKNEIEEVRGFSCYDNAARIFFQKYPIYNLENPLKAIKSEKSHIAIVGFDAVGKAILKMALNLGHFYDSKEKLKISVFCDSEINEITRLNTLSLRDDKAYWEVKYYPLQELLKEGVAEQYQRIVFTKRETEESIRFISELMRYHLQELVENNTQIYVYADLYKDLDQFLNKDEVSIKTFGYLGETCSYNVIHNQPLDLMAKKANFHYNKLHGYSNGQSEEEQWKSLNPFTQDSNRYQVEHLRYKIICLNYILKNTLNNQAISLDRKEAEKNWFTFENDNILWDKIPYATVLEKRIDIDTLEQLAKVEKNRWNAFHLLNGWKVLPIPSNTREPVKKNMKTKRHPCLVCWDKLDEVSYNHQHNYKSDDVETIMRSIDMILSVMEADKDWINQPENLPFKKFLNYLEII